MAVSPEFQAYLAEMFAPIPGVGFRRMFGGLGVYHDGAMFGLVADERLYFKIDALTEPRFAAAGAEPFVYTGKGKPIQMSYWTAPDDSLDDPDAFAAWARLGIKAARRAAAKKPKKPKLPGAKQKSAL